MVRYLIACSMLVLSACGPVPPSASSPAPPTSLPASPTPTVEAQTSPVALSPCTASQVVLTAGRSGVAAGTAYLRIFAELAQGPACSLPRSPMLTLIQSSGSEVARASETDPAPIALDYITGYNLGWNVPCGTKTVPDLVARIAFSAAVVIDLPIGDFGPSCVDGSQGSLSMIADDRD
jgi:hypothetical protein